LNKNYPVTPLGCDPLKLHPILSQLTELIQIPYPLHHFYLHTFLSQVERGEVFDAATFL
jgi:hypothetical protein